MESYLKQNGVPQLFVNSGSNAWDEPVQYPDLFGYQTSYVVEGKIFAHYIEGHFPNETYGFIGQNDDFGADGYLGLEDAGLKINSANHLSYNAADAITGSSSDIQADVGTLAANQCASGRARRRARIHERHLGGREGPRLLTTGGSSRASAPTRRSVEQRQRSGRHHPGLLPVRHGHGRPVDPLDPQGADGRQGRLPPRSPPRRTSSGNELYGAGFAVAFAEI